MFHGCFRLLNRLCVVKAQMWTNRMGKLKSFILKNVGSLWEVCEPLLAF